MLGALLIALCLSGFGCKAFTEAREDSKKAESAIKAELGVDAAVTFWTTSTASGTKTIVTVRLKTKPSGDAVAIRTKVQDIVDHTFRSHVDRVNVQ